ncbi:hypothetical protein C815_00687 [Firmicutes bacterium M10-2]|nr:hypothetical protein C815_00687 [Firmicutes bacterium M10-2]
MLKKIAPIFVATAILCMPSSMLAYEETKPNENTDPTSTTQKSEEISQAFTINTIKENTSNKKYTLNDGQALRFETKNDQIVTISDCTFDLKGTTATDDDPNTRNMKEYFKINVGDHIVFDHCSFNTSGSQMFDSITDSNILLNGQNIVFKDCTFEANHYEGRYLSAFSGDASFIDCQFKIEGQSKQPAFNVTEGNITFNDTSIEIKNGSAQQPCVYANGQDTGKISLINNSKLTIEENKAQAMELNKTPINVQNSKVLVQKNKNGVIGGTWALSKKSNLSSLDNEGFGLVVITDMKIDDSTVVLKDNHGSCDGAKDVDLFLKDASIQLKKVKDASFGSYVNQNGKIDKGDDSKFDGTLLNIKEPVQDPSSKKDEDSLTEQKQVRYDVTIRYIDAESNEDLYTHKISNQPEGEYYDFNELIKANVPKDFHIVAIKGEASGILSKDTEIIVSVQPSDRYFVKINYLDIENNEPIHASNQVVGIKKEAPWDVSRFDQLDIPGYEYIKTDHETSGQGLDQDLTINVYYKKSVINSLSPNQTPSQMNGAHTAARTNEGFYITVGVVALAALILLIVKKLTKKSGDDDDDDNE